MLSTPILRVVKALDSSSFPILDYSHSEQKTKGVTNQQQENEIHMKRIRRQESSISDIAHAKDMLLYQKPYYLTRKQ